MIVRFGASSIVFFSLFPFLGSLDHTKPEEKSRVPYLFSASFGQRIPTTSRCYPVATAAWYLFLLRTEQEPELDEICFNWKYLKLLIEDIYFLNWRYYSRHTPLNLDTGLGCSTWENVTKETAAPASDKESWTHQHFLWGPKTSRSRHENFKSLRVFRYLFFALGDFSARAILEFDSSIKR